MSETQVPGLLTSEEAAAQLGLPYRSLMRWVEHGILVPYRAGNRKKAPRLWAADHLAQARFALELREWMSEATLRAAMDALRAASPRDRWLVIDKSSGEASTCSDAAKLGGLMQGRRSAWVVRLGE